MRNLSIIIIIILLFLYQLSVFSQPCLLEGITFSTQEQIDNFQTNYPSCTEIEGYVLIEGNNITNLDGLSVLTAVGGYLWLCNNAVLTNVAGLQSISSAGGDFWITNNVLLTDLSPLENLTSIGGYFNVADNTSLTNLYGLENINPNSINDLSIKNNSLLSDCDIQSICEYLISPTGTIDVHDNAPGCNNEQEVEEACDGVSIEEIISNETFTISPNPSSSAAHLRFTIYEQGLMICELYEISGIKIKSFINEKKMPGTYEMEIDLNDLPAGIYFCVLKTNDEIQTRKLIKL